MAVDPFGVERPDLVNKVFNPAGAIAGVRSAAAGLKGSSAVQGLAGSRIGQGATSIQRGMRAGFKGTRMPSVAANPLGNRARRVGGAIRAHPLAAAGGLTGAGAVGGAAMRPRQQTY